MPGELRVDPQIVSGSGQTFADLAAGLPPAPAGFSVAPGADPLSAVAFNRQQASETPALQALPDLKSDSAATAGKIVRAAAMYANADATLSQRLSAVAVDPVEGSSQASAPRDRES